jgi:hypothetical protein
MQDIDAKQLHEILSYDPETGQFSRKVQRHRWPPGPISGSVSRGYRVISLDGRRYHAHRLAWLHQYGAWPKGMLDHINGNPMDNRIENLREASPGTNSENQRRARRDNKSSGLLGVSWHEGTKSWRAKIQHNWRCISLGLYKTKEDAHKAYIEAKRRIHSGCTL